MIRELENLCYEDRVSDLGLYSLEKVPGRTHCSLLVLEKVVRKIGFPH